MATPEGNTAADEDIAAGNAPAGPLRTLRELPRPVIVLLCAVALNRMGSFLAIFLVLYLTHLGDSPSAAGLALTVYGTGSIAGTFAGGSFTERAGARNTIAASMLLSGVAVGGVAVVNGFAALLALSFAAGALTQAYRPAATTLLAELTPRSRLVTTSAASRLGMNVGSAVGPLLGVWLLTYSYAAVFLVNASVSLVVAVVAWFALPRRGDHAGAGSPQAAAGPGAGAGPPRYRDLLRDHRFLLFLAGMFLTAVAEIQYQSILPLEIRARGLPTAVYGAVVALNGALVIAVELPLTKFIQRLPMRVTIAAGCLLLGGGLGLFGIPAGEWIFFAGTVAWTAGEIISAPSIVAYPATTAPTARLRSRYIGAMATCQAAGWAIGPSIGTLAYQHVGSAAWAMCAVLGLAAFAFMWLGVRHDYLPA